MLHFKTLSDFNPDEYIERSRQMEKDVPRARVFNRLYDAYVDSGKESWYYNGLQFLWALPYRLLKKEDVEADNTTFIFPV